MLLKVVALVEVDGRVWKQWIGRTRVVGVGGSRKVKEESEENWASDIVVSWFPNNSNGVTVTTYERLKVN